MRWFLSCLLLLGLVAFAQTWITTARLQAQFDVIPANRVAQIQNLISNQYTKADLFAVEYTEFLTDTNGGTISGYLVLDFAVSNKAAQVWSVLTNYAFPAGITGFLSIHQCAITNMNGVYVPCYGQDAPTYFRKRDIP